MKKILSFSYLFLILIGCQTNNIAVDYDNTYNFEHIKTYKYYVDNSIQLNKLDSTNFTTILDLALQSKGLIKTSGADDPDIFVAVQVDNKEGSRTNVIGLGVGGGSGGFGTGASFGIPINRKVLNYSIQIDFDDAKQRTLIWTGKTSSSTPYNASLKEKSTFFKSNIELLLKKYPPKIKSKNKK